MSEDSSMISICSPAKRRKYHEVIFLLSRPASYCAAITFIWMIVCLCNGNPTSFFSDQASIDMSTNSKYSFLPAVAAFQVLHPTLIWRARTTHLFESLPIDKNDKISLESSPIHVSDSAIDAEDKNRFDPSFLSRPLSSFIKTPEHFFLSETPENYIPLEEGQRLVCVGDVHGDYQALVEFLEIAGVLSFRESPSSSTGDTINQQSNQTDFHPYSAIPNDDIPVWSGNNTILVQCGDILDRGSQELACYELLAKLSHLARDEGGRVVCLYGNHEALNAMGLFQYATTDKEYENVIGKLVDNEMERRYDFKNDTIEMKDDEKDKPEKDGVETEKLDWRKQYVGNQPARWATYEPDGLLSRPLLCNLKVAIRVGRTICVHAGLTSEHLKKYDGIDGLNEKARAYILGTNLTGQIPYNNKGEYPSMRETWLDAEKRQTTYINSMPKFLGGGIGSPSPLWMRDYSSPPGGPPRNPDALSMIDEALHDLDCDRMVMGHTVQGEINAALDGKAWRIDVGASHGVRAGKPEVLEVVQRNSSEVVSVLTKYTKVPGENRHVWAMAEFL